MLSSIVEELICEVLSNDDSSSRVELRIRKLHEELDSIIRKLKSRDGDALRSLDEDARCAIIAALKELAKISKLYEDLLLRESTPLLLRKHTPYWLSYDERLRLR